MPLYDELFAVADKLETLGHASALEDATSDLDRLERAATSIGKTASGSWLGYHARVYYGDMTPPPPNEHFSLEWGLESHWGEKLGDWRVHDADLVEEHIQNLAGCPDLSIVHSAILRTKADFEILKAEALSILQNENRDQADPFLSEIAESIRTAEQATSGDFAEAWMPQHQVLTRDQTAASQGIQIPPHVRVLSRVAAIRQAFAACGEVGLQCRKAASHIERKARNLSKSERIGTNVFIGHGQSPAWRELKDFVRDRLGLPYDEFNRVPVAGFTNQARLAEMLDSAAIALIVMTAEDEMAEGEQRARMNVIHEAGLFQGRLGFSKAIVLLEAGCAEFSNIQGIGQIRFPAGNISACFEEVRRVMEREELIGIQSAG